MQLIVYLIFIMLTIFNLLYNSFAFIIILSIVVFIHEFGHYIVAILNGVKVDEFAIGYGKELYGWTDKRKTRWKICALPFGGFVKFFGDEDASSSVLNKDKLDNMSEENKKHCLYFKNVYQRISVVVAGPLFNYLLAIILFAIFFAFNGVNIFSNKITFVEKNSPAEIAGIKVNDRIISINNEDINTFEEIQLKITLLTDKVIDVIVDRNGEIIKTKIKLEIKEKDNGFGDNVKTPTIGIGSDDYIYKKITIFGSIVEGFKQVHTINKTTLKALGQMILGKRGLDDMSGPIKIAKYSGAAMKNGISSVIYFMALISTSLGLMNLLPIPVLDGGHLLFYILEAIRKKPLKENIENIFVKIGFSILITLMIFVTIKDLIGIF